MEEVEEVVVVVGGCISRSTHKLNGAKNFYLMSAFLPQVFVRTASGTDRQTAI